VPEDSAMVTPRSDLNRLPFSHPFAGWSVDGSAMPLPLHSRSRRGTKTSVVQNGLRRVRHMKLIHSTTLGILFRSLLFPNGSGSSICHFALELMQAAELWLLVAGGREADV